MKFSSIRKRLKKEGLFHGSIYYPIHLVAKIGHRIMDFWIRRYGKCSDTRMVFKNRINEDFSDNVRALYEYLIREKFNEKYQLIFLVSDKKKFRHIKQKNVKFVTAESRHGWNSPNAYYYSGTAKYFFYTHNTAEMNRCHCKGQITVNLWHGCGYKASENQSKKGGADAMHAFDYALVPGDIFVETKSVFWNCEKSRILPIGYPRYDWMLNQKNSEHQLIGQLFGEGRTEKTVIWMPTFRKTAEDVFAENKLQLPYQLPALETAQQMMELDAFCREKKLLLLIKKHHLQTEWEEKNEKYTNIRYVTEALLKEKKIQLYSLIGSCDALISDYSSVAVDYLLLDRPIGFILTDYEEYKKVRGFVFEDPLKYMPGEKIYDFSQLKKFLGHVAAGEDLFREERTQVLPRMHNQTENYCARITEALGIEHS